MNNPELLVTIITIILTMVSLILGFFASKNRKVKKYYETYLKVEKKVKDLCVFAELNYKKGENKKKYVLSNINCFLIANNIAFDIKIVENMIESLIKLTKSINNNNNNNQ